MAETVNSENELTLLRQAIDALDAELVKLLNQRAEYSIQVKRVKEQAKITAYVPSREREVIERAQRLAEGGRFPKEALRRIFQNIFSASRFLQGEQIVAYLGPRSSVSFDAAIRKFGRDVILQPETTVRDVFERVTGGLAHYGVVPIESGGGSLSTAVLEAFLAYPVAIVAEVVHRAELLLLAPMGTVGEVKKVFADARSLAMAERWLTANLPDITLEVVANPDVAAKKIQEVPLSALLGTEYLAETYNLAALARGIEEDGGASRYVVIGLVRGAPSGRDRTSLLCSVADRPGALLEILEPFARAKITLTKIESRVLPAKKGEYFFFVDFLGHRDEEVIIQALSELSQVCTMINVLGSYPVDVV